MTSSATRPFAHLHFEPVGGIAGDMTLGALIDLGADVGAIRAAFASLDLPGLTLEVSRVDVQGEPAAYVRSLPRAAGPMHRRLSEVLAVIRRGALSDVASARACEVFRRLAEAEADVHGGTAADVQLHEVGEIDSILDVVGISCALDWLGNPSVSSSPLPSGRGSVGTAHGKLECPVPAVRRLAARYELPLVPVPVQGETITPTGAAVLAVVCDSFTEIPNVRAAARGVGAGTKRFPDRPNVLRVYGYAEAV